MRIGVLGAEMIATVSYGVLPQLGRLADRIGLVATAGSGAFFRYELTHYQPAGCGG